MEYQICLQRPKHFNINLYNTGERVEIAHSLDSYIKFPYLVNNLGILLALQCVQYGGALNPSDISVGIMADGLEICVNEGHGLTHWLRLIPADKPVRQYTHSQLDPDQN